MGKKIIITRAHHQAQVFATSLVNAVSGINMSDFVFEPMTEIVHFPFDLAQFEVYDGIIMTSMNAAVSLGLNAPAREMLSDKPFYCVGPHTQQKIKSVGVQNVDIVMPSAQKLSDELLKRGVGSLCRNKRLLYMRGRDAAFDMKAVLMESKYGKELGVQVDDLVCYEAKAMERFSPNILEALPVGDIGLVTFFSERTAKIFARFWAALIEKDEAYEGILKGSKALCVSSDVAECVHDVFGKSACVVSKTADMAGMIDKMSDLRCSDSP